MNLSTSKTFTHKAKDYTSFYNQTGEPRVNVEGVVQIADLDGNPIESFGGSGGSGGGSIVYTNASGDFFATPTNGAKTITITGLPFTLEDIHVAAGNIIKLAVTTNIKTVLSPTAISVTGGVITLTGIDDFVTGDRVVVTLIGPDKAYDTALDNQLVAVQNPQYAHTTSVETLVSESAWPGLTATTDDSGGDATHIVDTAAPFTLATTATVLGKKVWNTTDGTYGLVDAWDSTTTQHTTGGTVVTWASKGYKMPVAKYYEINVDTYNLLTLHYRLTADLHTAYRIQIFGTLDATAVVDADTNWVNLSLALLGNVDGIYVDGITAGATVSAEDIIIIDTPTTMLKYCVKIIAEGNADAATGSSATVFVKKAS